MRRNLSIVLLVAVAMIADRAEAEPWRYCGDDYWFTAEPPEGWEISTDYNHMGVTLAFHPIGETDPAVSVIMPLGGGSMEPRAVDLEQALTGWISLVNAFGSPSRILNWDMRHPARPTRSAVVEGERGRLYISVVDAGSGRGHTFTVFLAQPGATASKQMLRMYRSIVSSLRFDATRACKPGPGSETVEVRIEATRAPAASAPASQDAFPIERAMSGCAILQQLFVPVYCDPAREADREVWVVSFDDGDDPASTYLERFRDRIVTPWCWAGTGRSDAPGLLFTTEGSDSLREYSCEASGWARTVQADRLKAVE